jgi:hypothetical protein
MDVLSPTPHSQLQITSPNVTLKFAARNVERLDVGSGHADCFFQIKVNGQVAYKSEVVKNQKHPSWNAFQLNLAALIPNSSPKSPKSPSSPQVASAAPTLRSSSTADALKLGIDLDQEIVIEVWDFDKLKSNDLEGVIKVPLRKILVPTTEFPIINPEKEAMARSLNYVHSGLLTVEAVVFREDQAVSANDLSRGGSLRTNK